MFWVKHQMDLKIYWDLSVILDCYNCSTSWYKWMVLTQSRSRRKNKRDDHCNKSGNILINWTWYQTYLIIGYSPCERSAMWVLFISWISFHDRMNYLHLVNFCLALAGPNSYFSEMFIRNIWIRLFSMELKDLDTLKYPLSTILQHATPLQPLEFFFTKFLIQHLSFT